MLFFLLVQTWLSPVLAWDQHQLIQEDLLTKQVVSARLGWYTPVKIPSRDEEKKELAKLASRLDIDGSRVPLYAGRNKGVEIPVIDLLTDTFIDEPDLGMDQDLPASSDPKSERKWMGGSTGPTSQAFRHMIFPGIEWSHPLRTFQIPLSSVGQALTRIELLRKISHEYLEQGNLFWGVRTLLWELHYIQDIYQPFHVVQSPTLKFLPFKSLFTGFVGKATHSIANYHYAYEGIAKEWMDDPDSLEFQKCFEVTKPKAFGSASELLATPRASAHDIGTAVFQVFGNSLKSKEIDLPNGVGELDYFALVRARKPELAPEEKGELDKTDLKDFSEEEKRDQSIGKLKDVTCTLVQQMSASTLGEINQALDLIVKNADHSSTSTSKSTGK